MGPDPENSVGDQNIRSPGRPVSSELLVTVKRGIVVQDQATLMIFPRRFSIKCPSIAPAEMSNTPL